MHAALSDVGLRRANNQDSFAVHLAGDDVDWYRRGHLLMVADGMGAHAAGELASKMACESIPHTYRKLTDRGPAEAVRRAVQTANTTIHERGQANAEFQGMGTTCSVLVLLPRGRSWPTWATAASIACAAASSNSLPSITAWCGKCKPPDKCRAARWPASSPRTSSPARWDRTLTCKSISKGRFRSRSATRFSSVRMA